MIAVPVPVEVMSQKIALRIPIRCPACCKGILVAGGAGLACGACAASYERRRGVVDLLPEAPGQRSLVQALMEWGPLVAIYESRLWRRSGLARVLMGLSFEEEYASVCAALRLGRDPRVLDLACGSGIYARRFAGEQPDGAVVGLDLSWPMLAYAAGAAAVEGLANLVLIHGNAGELPFEGKQFDAVNCCGALHLFPDVPATLAEIARVLAPGGRFTAAVIRSSARRRGTRRPALGGVTGFTRAGFADLCAAAGLEDFAVLHEARGWLVATAGRAATSGDSRATRGPPGPSGPTPRPPPREPE